MSEDAGNPADVSLAKARSVTSRVYRAVALAAILGLVGTAGYYYYVVRTMPVDPNHRDFSGNPVVQGPNGDAVRGATVIGN